METGAKRTPTPASGKMLFMRLPRVRFTVRRLLLAVAIVAMLFAAGNWLAGCDTLCAPGYSEDAFRSLRVGMTTREVEAIMGPPLYRITSQGQAWYDEHWMYTEGKTVTSSYHVRDVFFLGGQVDSIDSSYYFD
jgi:hypothetical protein